jgi:hypothetical protein
MIPLQRVHKRKESDMVSIPLSYADNDSKYEKQRPPQGFCKIV